MRFQRSRVAAGKFSKAPAVTLHMDRSRENLDPRNPEFLDFWFAPVDRCQFASIDPGAGKSSRKFPFFVIAIAQDLASALIQTRPQFFLPFTHLNVRSSKL